ncbi:TetR family transcriptional regulator [Brevibacterium sp. 5221]|uniref:TetR family transcriptional regulator n=1 Tax=Brevibacterium rongguiense TaxID=2695267 RepID=A0A6N9HA72_9MICO|nr:TetR/AcrR family transcriptional regulator [Brevibacterium rongguiense]MYM20666.1 TetR family transcriptional regulator [Brevibacterium rongguiense]
MADGADRTGGEATGDRRARKRRQTRRRLLDAARTRLAEVGLDALAVADITARADVGTGTFYNYFTGLDDTVAALIEEEVEALGRRIDALTATMADPAEVIAVSLRHLMSTAASDPVWGGFIVRLGIAHPSLVAALGPRASRDMQRGIDEGRFDIPNLPMAEEVAFGSVLSAIHAHQRSPVPDRDPTVDLAAYNLRLLGLTPAEAAEVCARPLPALPAAPERAV